MTSTKKKITLSPSRDIPFNQPTLSQSNVRRVKAGVSIEELAEDIARRGLLQGLGVRPVVDEAGGCVLRDLFQIDDGGWLQDVGLVDQMVTEKLARAAAEVATEGWKWVSVVVDFAYGHVFSTRQLRGEPSPRSAEEEIACAALQAEYDRLIAENGDADELPDDVDERVGELEEMLDAFNDRSLCFDPSEICKAGAFVSLAHDGRLRIERGFVRPEDELPVEAAVSPVADNETDRPIAASQDGRDTFTDVESSIGQNTEEDLSAISDRLMTELTAHRTIGLRKALGDHPEVAFIAALHALVLRAFYHYTTDSCLELDLKSTSFSMQVPGLNDSSSAEAIHVRHAYWQNALPRDSGEVWGVLEGLEAERRLALFAHVVSLSVNAVHESWNRRPRALAHADRLAEAVKLDMAEAGWRPTVDAFLGRVTKARILQAVAEAKGQQAADRIDPPRKGDMATEAETLLADTTWLPEPLPTRSLGTPEAQGPEFDASSRAIEGLATNDGERAMDGEATLLDNMPDADASGVTAE
jgi:ParB family chromosome partitioning protein